MTYAGCECTCSLTPGGKIASRTRTRSFSNLTRIVLELTTAGSCAYAGITKMPTGNATVIAKMMRDRIGITMASVESIATRYRAEVARVKCWEIADAHRDD